MTRILMVIKPDQRYVPESGSIAYRRRAMPLGRCHRSQRCPLRWSDRVTQRKCDRELTTRDDVPPRDFPDALHNSVPFPALPPTFDRQHAFRPGRLWCRSCSPLLEFRLFFGTTISTIIRRYATALTPG